MKRRYIRMSIIILLLMIVDQVTKFIIVDSNAKILSNVNIYYIQNYGGAFGIGGNSTFFFVLVNIVVLGIIIKFIYSQKDRIDRKTLASFTMILAGGFSNVIDRLARGFVVDFIDVTNFIDLPVFNIADLYIVVGWIMLFISIMIYWYKEVRVSSNK